MELCGATSTWKGAPATGVREPECGSILNPAMSEESQCPMNKNLPEWLIARLDGFVPGTAKAEPGIRSRLPVLVSM